MGSLLTVENLDAMLSKMYDDPFSDIEIWDFLQIRRKCEVRGRFCLGRPSQRHHGIFRRDKRFPQLDCLLNYQAVCENCHTGTGEADSRENRLKFYELQCDRYGKETVEGWIQSLPMYEKSL